jgi:RNA polymerase primary sigma factor
MKAVDKYESSRGVRFSTYASNWIRKSIIRGIQNQARTIRIPVHISSYISKMKRIERTLELKLGRQPTVEEIADEMNEKVERIKEIQSYVNDKISLDTPVGEEDASSLGDLISDTNMPNAFEEIVKVEYKNELHRILEELNPKEYLVITQRFGINDGEAKTLEEIGQGLGLTRERVRQIEAKALRKLRHPNRSEKMKQFMQV